MNKQHTPADSPQRFHGDKALNSSGHMAGSYVLPSGIICSYTINAQSPTARYPARGSVSLLDPRTGRVMRVKKRQLGTPRNTRTVSQAIAYVNSDSMDAEVLRAHIARAATALYNDHILLIADAAQKACPAGESSFTLLLAQHQQQYLARRTSRSNMATTYRHRLERVARLIGDRVVSRIPLTAIDRIIDDLGPRWREYLQESERFLNFVYDYRADSERINPFTKYLLRHPATDSRNPRRLQQKASNTDVLSLDEERNLNHRIESNIDNGILVGITLVKEGGLTSKEACHLTWAEISPMPDYPDTLLIALRKDDMAGATHNYTFPLLPFGSRTLLKRLAWLREQYSEEQICRMPVASAENDPTKALDPSRLTDACRTVLHNCGVGYAALAGLQDLHTGAGIHMLHATYRYRLEDVCRLRDDPGLLTFMLHHSLTNLVQADHYRSFTDPTAQHMLHTAISRDNRFDPPSRSRQPVKRKKSGHAGERVTVQAPSSTAPNHVTLKAFVQPDGELRISAPTGFRITDITVTPVGGLPARTDE